MSLALLFATLIAPPLKGQVRLAGEEIMGYVGRIARRTAFADDLIVFPIFLAVRSAPQQNSPFFKG